MFETLIESRRTPHNKRFLGVGFVSLTIHSALIAAAIIATVKAGQSDTKVRTVNVVMYVDPEQEKQQVHIPEVSDLVLPTDILKLKDIPPIDVQQKWDPNVSSRSGSQDGIGNSVGPTEQWYPESLVEEKPSVLSAPQPRYPASLRQARIGGRVLIQAIIDTSGRAESNSVRIIESPDPGFDPGSRHWILHALFRPARVHGRAVRVLIQVPLDYRITAR